MDPDAHTGRHAGAAVMALIQKKIRTAEYAESAEESRGEEKS